MKLRLPLLLAAILAQPCAALDFRLRSATVPDLDGAQTDFYFDDNGRRIFYRPPPQWRVEESAARCLLRPPDLLSGEMTMETGRPVAKLPPPGRSDREALEGYEKLALSLLARDARNGQIFESVAAKFGGRELPVTRIGVAYDLGGRKRRATFCFVLYKPDEILRIAIRSLEADYAAVHGTALHSLEAFTPES